MLRLPAEAAAAAAKVLRLLSDGVAAHPIVKDATDTDEAIVAVSVRATDKIRVRVVRCCWGHSSVLAATAATAATTAAAAAVASVTAVIALLPPLRSLPQPPLVLLL